MKRMEESKTYMRRYECSFDYSIDESFNTDYDKAQKTLNLLKDGESR
jgi:hypothetical protein